MNINYQQARLTRDQRFDGMFFIAVKTTKIFCRPICPANLPLEKNVEYFQLAQQAMFAGYRPCLRCRPDSAPHSYAWQGVDTTVKRAMRLLRQHHELSMSDIADKLGISSRYLRQLFQQKIGLGPKQYQLFDKILFAKQLLHQNNLPIEDIAQASGFASARRLQDNFKKITGLTPQEIRKNKSSQGQVLKLKIPYRPPYNWQYIRDFLSLRAIEGLEQITENSYSRTFKIKKDKGSFKLYFIQGEDYLAAEIVLDKAEQLSIVLSNIERIFDLNLDSSVVKTQLMSAGIPKTCLVDGIRLPGVWDTFEAGCRAILGQQISVKAAIGLLSLLTKELGEKLGENQRGIRENTLYFPTPESVANSELSFLKIPNSRKNTLRLFAKHILSNSNASPDTWLNIKGIGPWTAAYAKMRGLSSPDVWLDTDLIIKQQLTKYSVNTELVSPWRSYLTLQLWSMT